MTVFDVNIEGQNLVVISTSFQRINVPLSKLLFCKGASKEALRRFEVEEEGSYVYWPSLDMHLGWEQFHAIVDPASALKPRQKSKDFNQRFGAAVRKLREASGLKQIEIKNLSDRQLQRIESGECRVMPSAIEALASGHQMDSNSYLNRIAKLL